MKRIVQCLVLAVLTVTSVSSCTTAYDAYGRPYDAVDPGVAIAGAAAAGLLAYGLASSNNHHHHYRSYRDDCYTPRYRHSYYGGGYSGYGYGRRNCYY